MANHNKPSTGFHTNPERINKAGRAKREWTVASLIEDAMEEEDETGIPAKKIIYRKLVALAKKGDVIAIKELNNRLDGMPKQSIEHSGDEDSPIRIDITTTLKKAYGQRVTKTTGEVPKDGK